MKNILLVLVGIVGINLFSLDHGLISGFEVGYNLIDGAIITTSNERIDLDTSKSLYLELKTGYKFENLRIIGTYTNTMIPVRIDNFIPVQDRFKIDISYTFYNFSIGAFRFCGHPVITHNDTRSALLDSGQRAFYIKYYKEF